MRLPCLLVLVYLLNHWLWLHRSAVREALVVLHYQGVAQDGTPGCTILVVTAAETEAGSLLP
jgi:hypothetical protein